MRICFILEHYLPYIGGAEKLFRSLAEGLVSQGHEVRVVTTRFSRTLPRREFVHGVEIRRVGGRTRYLFTILSLPAAVGSARWSDVVHTTSYNAAFPAWLAARCCGRPIVITIHEVWGKLWREVPFMGRFSKWTHRKYERFITGLKYSKIVAVSEFTRNALLDNGVAPERVSMIYNGIDYVDFERVIPTSPPQFRCCYFGRLGVSKGLDVLLKGWHVFAAHHSDARLVLIIPLRPKRLFRKLMSLIKELGTPETVELRHNLSDEELRNTIASCLCVVIPSLSEGFCFTAVEAGALGIPVISSQRGALPEVVSGKFIPMKEVSTEAVSEALIRAACNEWDVAPTKKFHLRDMLLTYIALYQELKRPK